jgi:hypothetical protein
MTKNHAFTAGTFKKAHADKGYAYEYFMPMLLPDRLHFTNDKVAMLLEEATHHLGELNAFAKLVPDIVFSLKCMRLRKQHSQA